MLKNVLLWLSQRITAVLLIVLLGLHLWASNFTADWAALFRAVIDMSLLVLVLFHGLNGVRTVALDFGLGQQGRQFLSLTLIIVGIAALISGAYGIWPLLFAQ
jgi:succinate dehydrogenase / fumarate reductase membrane anchor subunit